MTRRPNRSLRIDGHPQRLRALARQGTQYRATTCPSKLADGSVCGHTLYSAARRAPSRRRYAYMSHLCQLHPELSPRERSVLADIMLKAETNAVLLLRDLPKARP